MAFCPNCGTPNTDQAEKCVSCGHELSPKPKAKFKGTIMMSGIQVPGQAPSAEPEARAPVDRAPEQPRAPGPAPLGPPPTAAGPRGFQKTMVGHAGVVSPPPPGATPSPAEREHETPGQVPVAPGARPSAPSSGLAGGGSKAASSANSAGAAGRPSAGFGGQSSTIGFGSSSASTSSGTIDSNFPGALGKKPSPGKALAIGCAAALLLSCVLGGVVWKYLFSSSDGGGAETAAWQASMGQSLAQVAALCATDCQQARLFFHANVPAAMLQEGRALTEERIRTLTDPERSEVAMLDATDDEEIAKALGLDPQQCARISAEAAKVISCSVPEPGGKPSVLRIVHLSGIETL